MNMLAEMERSPVHVGVSCTNAPVHVGVSRTNEHARRDGAITRCTWGYRGVVWVDIIAPCSNTLRFAFPCHLRPGVARTGPTDRVHLQGETDKNLPSPAARAPRHAARRMRNHPEYSGLYFAWLAVTWVAKLHGSTILQSQSCRSSRNGHSAQIAAAHSQDSRPGSRQWMPAPTQCSRVV